MKILQIHNYYRIRGGEDVVADNEFSLLRDNGIEVERFCLNSNSIDGFSKTISTALNLRYSKNIKKKLKEIFKSKNPSLVHVHNFFPLITPSVFDACKEYNIPSIHTIHNFRLFCASAILMRNGKNCELCLHGSSWNSMLYGCYKNSRLATFPLFKAIHYHRKKNTWLHAVDKYIVLSEFGKRKFIEAGLPKEKICIKPNFTNPNLLPSKKSYYQRNGGLFVGRLSEEKGIELLVKAWKNLPYSLKIIGEGPMEKKIKQIASPNISFLGKKTKQEVYKEMEKAKYLILPSICYENFGMAVIESYSNGLPVIASDHGSLKKIVENKKTGLKFSVGNINALKNCIQIMEKEENLWEKMSREAILCYKKNYTPEVNFKQLMQIYHSVIK